MSTLSEEVRRALYAALNVPAVVGTGKATGVHNLLAPTQAVFPYVVLDRQAASPVRYSLGKTKILEDDYWLIKVVTDEDASQTKEPQEQAEEILSQCEIALGDSLSLDEGSVYWISRHTDIPPQKELFDGRDNFIFTYGALFRIQAA